MGCYNRIGSVEENRELARKWDQFEKDGMIIMAIMIDHLRTQLISAVILFFSFRCTKVPRFGEISWKQRIPQNVSINKKPPHGAAPLCPALLLFVSTVYRPFIHVLKHELKNVINQIDKIEAQRANIRLCRHRT